MNNTSSSQIELFPEVIPATVEKPIAPHQLGGVKFLGICWPARLYQPNSQIRLEPEEVVRVVGLDVDNALLITPD